MWGCTPIEYSDVLATLTDNESVKLRKTYEAHRDRAIREHMPWAIGFPYYVSLLRERIHEYGRGRYVLRRLDPRKGFVEGNLEVVTNSESSAKTQVLTKTQSRVLGLYAKGINPKEISKRLKMKPGNVRTVITQGRARLAFAHLTNTKG